MSEMAFRKKLEELINAESMERHSNTPDWILAEYLRSCLYAFDKGVKDRDEWYGVKLEPGQVTEMQGPSTPPSWGWWWGRS